MTTTSTSHSSSSSSSSSTNQQSRARFFEEWMKLQEQELSELLQALTSNSPNNRNTEETMTQLVEKMIKNFEKYVEERSQIAKDDPSAYFGSRWCSSSKLPLLWLSGCRPSIYIRLLYALCGMQAHAQLTEFLEGATLKTGDLGDLSATQLTKVDDLQSRIFKGEEILSEKLASFQENIADHPIAEVASGKTGVSCGSNKDVDDALSRNEQNVIWVFAVADKFRLDTLKQLMNILSPVQAVEFLAASKKLHLCVHKWGKQRDQSQGFQS